MEFLNILPLRGPNIWTYRPAVEVWVDIGALEDSPSNKLPGFYERLTAWLPSLVEHHCGIGERGGFLQRLREGTWAGHILEHVTIELQNLAGMQTGFGKARETGVRGVYKVVVRSRQEDVTRAALHEARDLILAAIHDRPYDVAATVARLQDMVDRRCLGPSTACIVDAATERGIPSIRLTEGNLVQLGYGAAQRRIWTAETDRTSAIAEGISRDKDMTKELLSCCGIPIPEGRIVDSPEDAWAAAEEIGLPVVVKPSDGNHGRGVSIDLTDRDQIEAAFLLADAEGSEVIVERFIRGNEHRLLVVGGKLAAAARGESIHLIGDGSSTVRQLIDSQINSDPRRGSGEEFPLDVILPDENAAVRFELERQGYTPDSIPPAGEKVLIQRNGNVAIDVTDEVHPDVAATVALAARVVGLDIAGIDLVAEDISRPLAAQGGAIVEVNAGPSLLMHLKPASGSPRPVGEAVAAHLFAAGEDGRIPLVGISGSSGMGLAGRVLARLLHLRGDAVGLACSDGLYFSQRAAELRNSANWQAAQKVLMNRNVKVAVIESGADTILTEGLGYDRCLVGILTNIDAPAHFGKCYIETPEQVCNVLRTQVDVVLPQGAAVLNADDELVAPMAEYCDGEVIYFSRQPRSEVVTEHLARGGRAVLVREGVVMLESGSEKVRLVPLSRLPLLAVGQAPEQMDGVLSAIAAAWSLGVLPELMCAGLMTFENDLAKSKEPV
jgi:cyanophycin synthetase